MGSSVVEDLEVNRKVETLGATGSALKPTLVIENAVCISVLHQAAQLSETCQAYSSQRVVIRMLRKAVV